MKKLFLVLVLCLSVIRISGCGSGSSAPKEVEISPNTTKILEVGKDIAPGNCVVETDYVVDNTSKTLKRYPQYVDITKENPQIDKIKANIENGKMTQWAAPDGYVTVGEYTILKNGQPLVASKGKVIIIYSVGNVTLKQQ